MADRPAAALVEKARGMSDEELHDAIAGIRGNPKRAGSRARHLSMAETVALAVLMEEEARRVRA